VAGRDIILHTAKLLPERFAFQIMRAAKFCSSCGEKLIVSGRSFLSPRTLCARCAPPFQMRRLTLVLGVIIIAAIAFLIGRYTAPDRPVPAIGTPVDLSSGQTASAQPDEDRSQESRSYESKVPRLGVSQCGAVTRSGKPCQRKVLGGGLCYQHRPSEQKRQEADKTGGK